MRYLALFMLAVLCVTGAYAAEDKDTTTIYTGTAFVVRADGYLLTCAHVIEGATKVEVMLGGKTYEGGILSYDTKHDVALLQIDAEGLATLPLGNSTSVEKGSEVRAFGYPMTSVLGNDLKVTRGTISGMNISNLQKVFQIDAAVNPGNSGGPLVNEKGEVVGIVNAKLDAAVASNVGFGVPINYGKRLLRDEDVDFSTTAPAEKLDGPALVKRVSPAVALVRTTVKEGETSAATSESNSDAIKTKSLSIVDNDGKSRMTLSVIDNQPVISLMDKAGELRMIVTVVEKTEYEGPAVILSDKNGKVRSTLKLDNGEPEIGFRDPNGKIRLEMMMNKDLPALYFRGPDETTRVMLDMSQDMPGLSLYDAAGTNRAGLLLDKDENPLFTMTDKNNKLRAAIQLNDNVPRFNLYDDDEKSRIRLAVEKDTGPALSFLTPDGNLLARVGNTNRGPQLNLYSGKNIFRFTAGLDGNSAFTQLSDADGKTTWSAP